MNTVVRVALAVGILTVLVGARVVAADKSDEKGAGVLSGKVKSLAGKEVDLSSYAGKVVLIVNVASKCGYTPQYASLQQLHEKYADRGLAVLGFPCNQFGGQEPGDEKQIGEFCSSKYGVTFDMFSKIDVNGEGQCELYKTLTAEPPSPGPIKWNFEKFLVARDGKLLGRYPSKVKPDSPELTGVIEAALEAK